MGVNEITAENSNKSGLLRPTMTIRIGSGKIPKSCG
jgi:hypothetical protein